MAGYAYPGFGGRQPVLYAGPAPDAGEGAGAERPVVAILDTGCGAHAWLGADVVIAEDDPDYGGILGVGDPDTDPEVHPSQGDPLDGVIDIASGHGTFIAGIVRQACPSARILPVRVSNSAGIILESDLLGALGRLVALVEAKHPIHVLNLSFSFYHESSDSSTIDSELYALLKRLRAGRTTIVCSAGNDATDRPSSPASLHAWDGNEYGLTPEQEKADGLAPHVVVGALNPSGRSTALFSNVGDWVDVYAKGVAIVSAIPRWEAGGIQADLRADEYGKRRETFDVDDFGSGFAVWSGTSFAAPLVAGGIAQMIATGRTPAGAAIAEKSTLEDAVAQVVDDFIAEDESGLHGTA
ncbi:S8/S53 family peptidase [Microbacterium ulmi]|uniref:S8/S53 family peptidase n=2 Tax=Microbacterium ulmi TaxID=179095 RepID=A0A7Y2Q1K3_9MICO|nr:S8/S53 family peptidase [Microbacterium ulmi]